MLIADLRDDPTVCSLGSSEKEYSIEELMIH